MTSEYLGFTNLHEERPTVSKDFSMMNWIPPHSTRILYVVCSICIGLNIIILAVVIAGTKPEEKEKDRTTEFQIGNLSVKLFSKLDSLSQDGKTLLEKINEAEKSVQKIIADRSKDALQSDVQSVRDAVWRLTSLVKNLQINGSAAPECPEDWKQYSLSCYYLSKDTKSWPSAKKFCESKSSHLVTINTREEQNYLQGLKPGEFVWIGLTDVDGHWKWEDGTNYETALKYWKEGQPDEYFGHGLGGGEDCAHLLHNGEWNDEHCSRPYFYICENNILSKP